MHPSEQEHKAKKEGTPVWVVHSGTFDKQNMVFDSHQKAEKSSHCPRRPLSLATSRTIIPMPQKASFLSHQQTSQAIPKNKAILCLGMSRVSIRLHFQPRPQTGQVHMALHQILIRIELELCHHWSKSQFSGIQPKNPNNVCSVISSRLGRVDWFSTS